MVYFTNQLSTATPHVDRRTVANIQIMDFSFCVLGLNQRTWTTVITVLQITHSGAVCTLAIVQFVRQSLQMYRATKQWRPNQYMSLLVKQGILYFLAYVLVSSFPSVSSAVIEAGKQTDYQRS